jgi:hypothetical protein
VLLWKGSLNATGNVESACHFVVGAVFTGCAGVGAGQPRCAIPPGGLCLVMLNGDGSVAYSDSGAGLFFQRFAVPMMQYPDAAAKWAEKVATVNAQSPVEIWTMLPGVVIAAFPYVDKRPALRRDALAAKGQSFRLGEEVLRVCSRLGLDGIWLNQQAEELPVYGDEAIHRQARLLLGMIRDQVRLSGLETELDSLSGQLANTYEELSLIYQLSSGMKINRRAGDFFKQACLDVMDVMGVRGMGVTLQNAQDQNEAGPLRRDEPPAGKVQRLSEELMKVLCGRKSPLLVNNLAGDRTFAWLADHAKQLIAVPLQRQDQVLGCLFGIDKLVGEFDSVDSKLLNSIANESAIYLENVKLFEGRARPDDGPAALAHVRGRREGRVHLRSLRARRLAQPSFGERDQALRARYRTNLHGGPPARRRQDRCARSGPAEDRQADQRRV